MKELAHRFDALGREHRAFWIQMAMADDRNGRHVAVCVHTWETLHQMQHERAVNECWTWLALARQSAGMEPYGRA